MRSLAARAVPDGRDIEAKLAQATIAVIQCCSQQIGQRFAVASPGRVVASIFNSSMTRCTFVNAERIYSLI